MFSSLINTACYGAFCIVYGPFVILPLLAINSIVIVFELLSVGLPQYLLFGINLNQKFELAILPNMFKRIAIISTLIYALLFIFSALRLWAYKGEEENNPIRIALKNSLIGTIWLIGLPIAIYLLNLLLGIILNLVLNKDNLTSLDKTLFRSIWDKDEISGISYERWVNISNNKFFITYNDYINLQWGQGPRLIFIGSLMGIGTLIPLGLGLLTLVTKIFQQLFLFIISPFVAASSVADDGKRIKQWQEMYLAKSFVIVTFVIAMQIYALFLSKSIYWANTLNLDYVLKLLLMIGLALGGAVGSMGLSSEVAAFIGESASVRETLSETKGLIASGMALAGGVGVAAKAFGKTTKLSAQGANSLRTKLLYGSTGTEALSAKRSLRQLKKSGKISKQDYKIQKSGLAEAINEQRQIVSADKLATKQEGNSILQEIKTGDTGFKKSDIKATNKQLIRKESRTIKQMENLANKGDVKSEKYAKLAQRHEALAGLLDTRIARRSNTHINLDSSTAFDLENAKRKAISGKAISHAAVERNKLLDQAKTGKGLSSELFTKLDDLAQKDKASSDRNIASLKSKANLRKTYKKGK